jgi:hypothetical protein
MRIRSHHAPNRLRQLLLVGLTFELYSLRSRIEVIRTEAEVRETKFFVAFH